MRYTNEQIRYTLIDFVQTTCQPQLVYVISFCVGYYGCITKQIWTVIRELMAEDVIK